MALAAEPSDSEILENAYRPEETVSEEENLEDLEEEEAVVEAASAQEAEDNSEEEAGQEEEDAAPEEEAPDENSDAFLEENAKTKVYLTFDDGPSSSTSKILDVLKRYDVRATFFVIGREEESYQKLYRRIVDEGHTLGMHSYTHKYSELYESVDSFIEDFNKEQ
ncbi:MAG: polysaccharide deacetylase family protein, partial [Lachnospiraceae bacterium]|nr:polysaccharide deacetylase family protein [Lachnospiraceae bacterium]